MMSAPTFSAAHRDDDQMIDRPDRNEPMTSPATYLSPYDRRVRLVTATITERSELTEKAATELAGHVLYALDHIPETVRYSGK
jgi:hypothetical protein